MALTLAHLDESGKYSDAGTGGGAASLILAVQGEGNSSSRESKRERLFEKVVTPSDVGKLNRLVVPKHFAEKHLPLLGGAAARAGTVLCFHDARGPTTWRFRYSYWGSSQSYVMTKGWSRYVRDKRLATGDTVAFCRDGARLYIDCRRRRGNNSNGTAAAKPSSAAAQVLVQQPAQAAASAALLFLAGNANNNKVLQQQQRRLAVAPASVVVDDLDARRGRSLRLFGVDLELRAAEPMLLDLQL